MKKLIAFMFFAAITTMSFAQKNEMKMIEKALKSSNFAEAKSAATAAESLLGNMDDKTKAKFYYLKAQALYANGTASDADLDAAMESFNMLRKTEKEMGKLKYTEEVNKMVPMIIGSQVQKASDAYEAKNFAKATKGFERVYKMSPKDTVYLYFAASAAVSGQDYDTALEHYHRLKDFGYSGEQMMYFATKNENGQEESFGDKTLRDASVKSGTYSNPRDEKSESRKAEIVKNIALIYVSQGKNDEALKAMSDARAENPDDTNLIINEANIYMDIGQEEKASKLYKEALDKDPQNKDLKFNVGVFNMNAGNNDEAAMYFQKALNIDPSYSDAAMNLSSMEISKGNALNDQMNELPMNSNKDFDRYDELKAQKNEFFKKAAIFLEDFVSKNPSTTGYDVYNQLKNIYSALGETQKSNEMRAKIEALGN